MYRFKVTVRCENEAEITYMIETMADNETAARDQIELLVEEPLEVVSIESIK